MAVPFIQSFIQSDLMNYLHSYVCDFIHQWYFNLTCFELVKYNFAPRFKICSFTRSSSTVKFLAIFLRTSGAIFGTRSQYSPVSQRMLALATGTLSNKSIKITIYNLIKCLFEIASLMVH